MSDLGIETKDRRAESIGQRLIFHRSGTLRNWVKPLVFGVDGKARSLARRIVFRADGKVRSAFAVWTDLYAAQLRRTQLAPAMSPLLTLPPDLETLSQRYQEPAIGATLASSDEIARIIETGAEAGSRRLLLAITHDNYRVSIGGIQTCLSREEQCCHASDVDYLVAFPRQPGLRLADTESDPILGLILNGRLICYCRSSALTATMGALHSSRWLIDVTIHQLLGHRIESVAELISASGLDSCWFWVHDFFSICPNYILRRNNREFCGAPDISSDSCLICVYGKDRADHMRRMKAFFDQFEIHVIAPSQSALTFWLARSGLRSSRMHVNPHIELAWRLRPVPRAVDDDAPIRVAFVGLPVEQKGWLAFERLATSSDSEIGRYEFLVLGERGNYRAPELQKIRHVEVRVTPEHPLAMSQALEAHGIDLIVQWPTTQETFSLATYEGLESGAYVVTHRSSGNVAAAIGECGRGVILSDEAELLTFFATGGAMTLGRKARAERAACAATRRMSSMTLTYLALDA
ncbi:hypothetical protein AB4Y85_13880 [Microvirga sp. 2YAF29]|uniref:hypothetical protein n=1 Tax=Microvirga sp. 2YAF29 TaxID=3233031 RepID=UPI003F9794EF